MYVWCKDPGLWVSISENSEGPSQFQRSWGMDSSFFYICITALLLCLPSPASLAPNLGINHLHVNLHLRVCFREPNPEAEVNFPDFEADELVK